MATLFPLQQQQLDRRCTHEAQAVAVPEPVSRCVDTLAGIQDLLGLMREYENLLRKRGHVHDLAANKPFSSLDDRGPLSRAEDVGRWLVHKLCFALIHQGPYCAALVLQVRLCCMARSLRTFALSPSCCGQSSRNAPP